MEIWRQKTKLETLFPRIEDNYIDNSIIQESIDEGTATAMKKKDKIEHSDTLKCRILIRGDEAEDNPYKQKEGEPPDPANAPPPKHVRDKGRGKGKGKAKGTKGKGGKGRTYQYWGVSREGGKGYERQYHTPKPRSEYSEWQSTRRVTYKDSNDRTNKWSKDSTWQSKQTKWNETKYDNKSYDKKSYDKKSYDNKSYDNKSYDKKSYDKKSYDNKSYDKKSYDNKSYDKHGKQEKYDKNNSKEGWSKAGGDKWNSSKWESKQDGNSRPDGNKWSAKTWESSWEKTQVAAYTGAGGTQRAKPSNSWDSGSWKADKAETWTKASDYTENGRYQGHQGSKGSKGGKGSTKSDVAVPKSAVSKISEAERSRRWDQGKGKSWNREETPRGKNGRDSGKSHSALLRNSGAQ